MNNKIAGPVKKEDDGRKNVYHKDVVATKGRNVKAVSARLELEEVDPLVKGQLAAARAEENAASQELERTSHAEYQDKLASAKRALNDAEENSTSSVRSYPRLWPRIKRPLQNVVLL